MDLLNEKLQPINERRKATGLTTEQIELIDKDEQAILINQFKKLTNYAYRINAVNSYDDFNRFIGKTHEMINKIEKQVNKEITKFLKKYMIYEQEGSKIYELILQYLNEEAIEIEGEDIRIGNYNYCLRLKQNVNGFCECCDYEEIYNRLY